MLVNIELDGCTEQHALLLYRIRYEQSGGSLKQMAAVCKIPYSTFCRIMNTGKGSIGAYGWKNLIRELGSDIYNKWMSSKDASEIAGKQ